MGKGSPKDTTPPVITSPAYGAASSGQKLNVPLSANEVASFMATGGDDAAQFEVAGSTLRWLNDGTRTSLRPLDANKDNLYVVQITAKDTAGNVSRPLTIIVTVVNATSSPQAVFFPFFV